MITLKNTRIGAQHGNISGGFCIAAVQPPYPGSFIMRGKIKYQKGQKLGLCYYIKEMHGYTQPNGVIPRRALFKCECGNEFVSVIHHVKNKKTKSCGCQYIKHNLSDHTLYGRYKAIISRCYNTYSDIYKYYGGRGITMYQEWLDDVKTFYDYVMSLPDAMGEGLTLDRRDNNGNYEPGNIRWVSMHIQGVNQNKRISKTGYTGIYIAGDKFTAKLYYNYKSIHIGTYVTINMAIKARNEYIINNNFTEYKLQ